MIGFALKDLIRFAGLFPASGSVFTGVSWPRKMTQHLGH
jgi:hypothetical protein